MASVDELKINPKYLRMIDVKKVLNPEFLDSHLKITESTIQIEKKSDDLEIGNLLNQMKPGHKVKGKNKNRPVFKKETRLNHKLCPYILRGEPCSYSSQVSPQNKSNTCGYIHDISTYLETKPNDINDLCPTFRTFGYCPQSFACRFASDHLSKRNLSSPKTDLDDKLSIPQTNIIDKESWAKNSHFYYSQNLVSKLMLEALRKRKYNFKSSLAVSNMVALHNSSNINADDKTPLSYIQIIEGLRNKYPLSGIEDLNNGVHHYILLKIYQSYCFIYRYGNYVLN